MAVDTNSYANMANQDPIQDFLNKQKKKQMAAMSEPNPISKDSQNVQSQADKTANTMVNATLNKPTRIDPVAANIKAFQSMPAASQTQLLVASSPDNVKTVVTNMPGQDATKDQVNKLIDNPKLLQQKQIDIQTKKSTGQPLGMVDNFVDALTFFLPTALGAAIGAIGGGNAAGAAGAQAGTELGNAYRQYGLDRMKAQQAQQLNQQEMLLRQNQAQYYQNRADATQANLGLRQQEIQNAQERINLEKQKESRLLGQGADKQALAEAKQGLAEQNLAFNKEKAAQLSPAEIKDINKIQNVKNQLDSFDLSSLSTTTGPIEGRLKSLASNMGISTDTKFEEMKANIASTLANQIHALSGTAASEKEVRRLADILPKVTDNNVQFITKLNRFKKETDGSFNTLLDTMSKGNKFKAKTIKQNFQEQPQQKQEVTTDRAANLFRRLGGK